MNDGLLLLGVGIRLLGNRLRLRCSGLRSRFCGCLILIMIRQLQRFFNATARCQQAKRHYPCEFFHKYFFFAALIASLTRAGDVPPKLVRLATDFSTVR